MQFFSTRDQSRKVTASEAIAQGLSQEGGLFVPESFPQVDVQALCGLDYPTLAAEAVSDRLFTGIFDFRHPAELWQCLWGQSGGYGPGLPGHLGAGALARPYLCV